MYVIDDLPIAGTTIWYKFGDNDRYHITKILDGVVFTKCGMYRPFSWVVGYTVNNLKDMLTRKSAFANANLDSWHAYEDCYEDFLGGPKCARCVLTK